MRFFGRYLNRSILGPLVWSTTVTLTSISLTIGVPTMTSSPSAISRMRSMSNLLPASTGRRSTSMVRPSIARYCLPPLSIIANLIFLFSSHSLRRVPAELVHSSPASGEAGVSLVLDIQPPQRNLLLRQKRTILYMGAGDVSTPGSAQTEVVSTLEGSDPANKNRQLEEIQLPVINQKT